MQLKKEGDCRMENENGAQRLEQFNVEMLYIRTKKTSLPHLGA